MGTREWTLCRGKREWTSSTGTSKRGWTFEHGHEQERVDIEHVHEQERVDIGRRHGYKWVTSSMGTSTRVDIKHGQRVDIQGRD